MTGGRGAVRADVGSAAAPRRASWHGWGGGPGATGWTLRPDRGEALAVR